MSTETPTILHETVLKYEIDQLDHRLPILKDAIMALDCRLLSFQDVGSHTVYFGTVVATLTKPRDSDGAKEVLIYHDRHYGEA